MMNNYKPMRRNNTFSLKRSPTLMELPNQYPITTPRPPTLIELQNQYPMPKHPQSKFLAKQTTFKRSPAKYEFPTSPQPFMGEERIHSGHPQHPLVEIDIPDLFTCSGCKEFGSGKRFTCQRCEFQLHEFCALAPQSLKNHPLHCQHQLLFSTKPAKGGGIMKSKCDACGKPTKGYCFKCSACTSFQMHPCCAMLATEIKFPVHPHTLKLLPVTPSTNGDAGFICGECKKRRSGKVYRCSVCDYHLHAICAKNMFNGLQANNIKGPEKANMLGTAARFASQVVIEFIGGLIEGIGEGVGEAIIQSATRGGGRRTTTATTTTAVAAYRY